MNAQLACSNCRSTFSLRVDGNAVDLPLTCPVCDQTFAPHFYCPDARSSARHVFVATTLRVDNAGALYAFCPAHTFTTYALAPNSTPRPKQTPLHFLVRLWDSMTFRLMLNFESLRWQSSRRRVNHPPQ